jgi:ribosomal protein S18 acetylase RimI-like enzyme
VTTTVTPATADDIAAVAALMRETIAAVPYYSAQAIASELTKYTGDALHAMHAADAYAVMVSRDDAGLTGFCVSRWDDATVWLSWFGVAARARGQGIGAALVAALQASLPARGAHKIWCDSRADNVESIAVLERAGFRRIATLDDHWFHQDYLLWQWQYPKH